MVFKTTNRLIRVIKVDKWTTAVWYLYGLYELVMHFGLTSALAIFQDMKNHIFKDLLDEGVVGYIDVIVIYTTIDEQHELLVIEF
jgi:hypothetical protein